MRLYCVSVAILRVRYTAWLYCVSTLRVHGFGAKGNDQYLDFNCHMNASNVAHYVRWVSGRAISSNILKIVLACSITVSRPSKHAQMKAPNLI